MGKHKHKHREKDEDPEKEKQHKSSKSKSKSNSKSESKSKSKSKSKRRSSSTSSSSSSDVEYSETPPMQLTSESISSAFSQFASSHKTQLGLTAVASGVLVGASILGYQNTKRKERTQWLKDSIPPSPSEGGESFDLYKWNAHSASNNHSRNSSRNEKMMIGPTPPPVTSREGPPSKSISDGQSTLLARRAQSLASASKPIPEELILEQLSRNHSFLGTEGLKEIRKSFIIIVGLGGVGSWATSMLVRSGVGKVRLVDFDQVTLSSLNRHAVATLEDVGTPKVVAMKKHLERVAPWVAIESCVEVWREDTAEALMEGEPSYVIDAIDNIDTKVDLLAYCHRHNIPVISSMGAGCKSDPTRICVGDISETFEDPLSKSTRRKLRAKGVATGVTVVYSTEKPGPGKAQLLPLDEEEFQKGGVTELGVLPDFRVRILPVLGTMPATFGLAAANHILTSLAKYPLTYLPGSVRFRPKLYKQMLDWFNGLECRMRHNRNGLRIPLTESDIGYLVEEMFAGKSVVSGATNRIMVARWRKPSDEPGVAVEEVAVGLGGVVKVKLTDLVIMTKDELQKHEARVLRGHEMPEDIWGEEVSKFVEKKWEEERQVMGLYR